MALSKEEKEVHAASDLTAALRRTHEMMSNELSRSQFAHETLNESTAALAQLSETYSTLDTLLSSSKNLLGTLVRSNKSDTWYLETAFYILCVTVAWLIFRRLLYGPAWWLLWFTPKIFIRSWIGVFNFMGMINSSPTAEIGVSSVAGSQSVIHNSGTRSPMASISGARAPTIRVGGGGRGASMRPAETPSSSDPEQGGPSDESLSEQVGKIIDESNQEANDGSSADNGEQAGEGQAANQPNPKKRMWEEDKEAAKYEEQRKKNEL